MSHPQLVLPINTNDPLTLESFVWGANAELKTYLTQVATHSEANTHSINLICAAKGMGKTHLLSGVISAAQDHGLQPIFIDLAEHEHFPIQILQEIEQIDLICLDNVDALTGLPEWENAIFDLINRVLEIGKSKILITMSENPEQAGFGLPDLVSRLLWGQKFYVAELSEQDKEQLIRDRAERRGFELPKEVARYLIVRLPRDLNSMLATLDTLDEQSLQKQRKLTIPFVKSVLDLD